MTGEQEEPLLSGSVHRLQTANHPQQSVDDVTVDMDDSWDEESDDRKLFVNKKPRGVSLVVNDAVMLFLQYLQLLALLQSLALRWTWPLQWLRHTNFLFLFNLDVWEFSKIQSNGTYESAQGHYTPSVHMPLSYWHILAAWAGLLGLGVLVYLLVYTVIRSRKRIRMRMHLAMLQRIYVTALQVLAIPLGVTLGRIFHCTDKGLVDVDNEMRCYEGIHWAYVGVALCAAVLFVLFPVWMIQKTKSEMLNMSTERHEAYLQLKETEYIQGLDVLYIIGSFYLFSSFKKSAAYMRPTVFYFVLALCILFAGLYNHVSAQAVSLNCCLFIILLSVILMRPYRVTSFNVVLIISYLCLNANCLLGCLVTTFNVYTLKSPYLTRSYVLIELAVINGFWLLCFLGFVIYLVTRTYGCWSSCCKGPLWPAMTSDGLADVTPETRKYVKAILHGRNLLEQIVKMPALFAPVHELERQIQIINSYCREAEYIRDPIHDSLWDLLDELIDTHDRLAPKSLFSESVKDSGRVTAEELLKIMPMFVRRLAQREYDFILVNPVKRSLLFKMYILGMFLNGRRDKLQKEKIAMPAVQKLWNKSKAASNYPDHGYYEDMYPEKEETGLVHRPVLDLHGRFDEDHIFTAADKSNPGSVSSQAYENKASKFDNLSEIIRDDVSDDVSLLDATFDIPPEEAVVADDDTAFNKISNAKMDLSQNTDVASEIAVSAVVEIGSERPNSATIFRPSSASSNTPGNAAVSDSPGNTATASVTAARSTPEKPNGTASVPSGTTPGIQAAGSQPGSAAVLKPNSAESSQLGTAASLQPAVVGSSVSLHPAGVGSSVSLHPAGVGSSVSLHPGVGSARTGSAASLRPASSSDRPISATTGRPGSATSQRSQAEETRHSPLPGQIEDQ